MSNAMQQVFSQLKPIAFSPGDHEGSIEVRFAAQIEFPVRVSEDVVKDFDNQEVVEATRSIAATQLIGIVYGPAAAQLIALRDTMPKKYHTKINKILATFIASGDKPRQTVGD
jgi:hypothetical protein